MLFFLGLASEAIYIWLARFDAQNGSPVFWFLLAFFLLFAIYALGARGLGFHGRVAQIDRERQRPASSRGRGGDGTSTLTRSSLRSALCHQARPIVRTSQTAAIPRPHESTSEASSDPENCPETPRPETRHLPARPLAWIVVFGVLFRLTLVPAGLRTDLPILTALWEDLRGEEVGYEQFLLYDQDVWRYLWEGHVWASGFDPFRHAPGDTELDGLAEGPRGETWEEIRDRVTYPELASIYPPLAQFLFRLSHLTFPASAAGLKLWLIALECLAGWLLFLASGRLGIRPDLTLFLFAWNPLTVKAFSGSAHFDVLVVLGLALLAYAVAAGRSSFAAPSIATATLAKLVPAILLAISPWRWRGVLLAGLVLLIGVVPFRNGLASRFLDTGAAFASDWRFNAAPFSLLEWLTGVLALPLYILSLAFLVIWIRRWSGASATRQLTGMLWLLGFAIVLGPVVHPWYVTWLLPMACLLRDRVWLFFSGLVFMAFFVMFDGIERQWVVAIEYSILGGSILFDPFWRRRP